MLSDTVFLYFSMITNNQKTVKPAPGAELPDGEALKRARLNLQADLKTARVLCLIVSTDEDVQRAVIHHLQRNVKTPPDTDGLRKDATMASMLCRLILDHDIMLDNLADVVVGLQANLLATTVQPKPES